MKNFKDCLLESDMSQTDALKILDIKSFDTVADLKKAYKRASIKAHPDKGGTANDMQKVNAAYAVLGKTGSASSTIPSYADRKKEAEELGALWKGFVLEQFNENFDIDAYTKYLSEAVAEDLVYNYVGIVSYTSSANITVNWKNKGNKIAFSLHLNFLKKSASGLSDQTDGLKIGEVSYTTEVLINRKKVKMKQSNFSWGAKTKNIFKDPKQTFPPAKIKKALGDSNKPLKRADYMLTFKNELNSKISGNVIRIPLTLKDENNKDCYIYMERFTWMRKGVYNIQAVMKNSGSSLTRGSFFTGIFESPKSEFLGMIIDMIQKVQKMKTLDSVVKELVGGTKKLNEIALKESAAPKTFKDILNEG